MPRLAIHPWVAITFGLTVRRSEQRQQSQLVSPSVMSFSAPHRGQTNRCRSATT